MLPLKEAELSDYVRSGGLRLVLVNLQGTELIAIVHQLLLFIVK